tara:strand:+ start:40750 stop:41268 length:519 start_codon:yes stop_codon:yes gene_type:complete
MSTSLRCGVRKTLTALGKVLTHVNENMPVHEIEGFAWEREEQVEGRACLWAADIPEKFWEDFALTQGFLQRIAVEALRFESGDHIDLHRHNAAASSILVPREDFFEGELLKFEMFREKDLSKGERLLSRNRSYGILPGIWHSIRRVGEGDYAYLFSASAPIIGNDIVWYADQ